MNSKMNAKFERKVHKVEKQLNLDIAVEKMRLQPKFGTLANTYRIMRTTRRNRLMKEIWEAVNS